MSASSSDPLSTTTASGSVGTSAADGRDFAAFYQGTVDSLRRYLSRILGSRQDAQDIAQDAYLRTYQAQNERELEKPKAFLFTTGRRLALNFRQRRGLRMVPTEPAVLENRVGADQGFVGDIIASQERSNLEEAMNSLPPICRDVLILQMTEGLTHAQIGKRLGIAQSTVANAVTRALKLLRTQMNVPVSNPGKD